jgi:hypothetical protein
MTSKLNKVILKCNELTRERVEVGKTVTKTFSDMATRDTEYYLTLMSGLDASTLKIVQSNDAHLVTWSNMTDTINTSIWSAYANSIKVEQIIYNNIRYGDGAISKVNFFFEEQALEYVAARYQNKYVKTADLSTIFVEGSRNRSDSRREKRDIYKKQVTRNSLISMPYQGWDSQEEILQHLSYQNIKRYSNDASGEIRASILGVTLGKFHAEFTGQPDPSYTDLNYLHARTSGSTDSFVRGAELSAISNHRSLNEIASLNEHGLYHKYAITKQIELVQYKQLLDISQLSNIITALDIADEKFK